MGPSIILSRRASLDSEGRRIVEHLGGEWRHDGGMCLCPAHADSSPSLSVRPGSHRLLFHCFSGCPARDIIRELAARQLLALAHPARRTSGEPARADLGRRKRGAAAAVWAASRPVEGSPAEAYLLSRALALRVSDLRYNPRTPYGRGPQTLFRPALIAAVRDDTGLVAIHRTFLDLKPPRLAGLAVPKRALGGLGLGAVRLRAPREGVLGWAEGIETAMAATLLTGIPCWAALGSERFARVALPRTVKRLILFLDNDAGGRRAELLAREACGSRGVEIERRYPAAAEADWNDVLLGRAAG